ncbi:MAG: nucleotidyltransferase family protein [Bacteroidales bacterium]|nr:nucleotidyltransferase family protein [Bacteroidales bacterium]
MKALILAAGLGTRLHQLTYNTPKALIEVGGKPMLERIIQNLKVAGVTKIIINLHHFPEKIKAFLATKEHFGIDIHFSEETNQALETGGGLKKTAWFFDDGKPFIVHNVDILTNINLSYFMDYHLKNDPLATLFVQQRNSSRYLLFNNEKELCGWTNNKTGETIISKKSNTLTQLAFNGIHVINPEIFDLIKIKGKFSIVQVYLELAKKFVIHGFEDKGADCLDIGKPDSLIQAEILARKFDNRGF